MKKISIIIPVYNVEKYVADCIESAINQTMEDIEIVCIDDASTDHSLSIIEKYAKDDKRIKIIKYKENKSASQGRKDGVMQSDSEYILFLDGDDYLECNACEELYDEMKKHNVDILHFGTKVINEGKLEQKRIDFINSFLIPYNKKLEGINVFEKCFVEKKYRFSIWNKLYNASLCKEAFHYVKDGLYPKAQDLYAFFIISFFAKSYFGLCDKHYINYRYGAGITGNSVISIEQLKIYCSCAYVAKAIEEFIINQNEGDKYADVVREIRENLLGDCLGNWFHYLPNEFAAKGFDLLAEYWKDTEIVSLICKRYNVNSQKVANKILGAKTLLADKYKKVKTIGIFCKGLGLEEEKNIISQLIPMYIEKGYQIVLFINDYADNQEYTIPDQVKKVVLPSSLEFKKDEYITRAIEFKEHLLVNNIDIMFYNIGASPQLLYDMMLIKMQGIPFFLTIHEEAFYTMLTMNSELSLKIKKLENENQKIKNSISYKMCCILTVVPKLFKKRIKRILGK